MDGLTAASTLRRNGFDVRYLAQGAATAMEDAAALARCLADTEGDNRGAFARDEAHRKPRTSRNPAS